jgi:Tfp pilus assembly protein PilX
MERSEEVVKAMCEETSRVPRPPAHEQRESGFALVLAIMALLLLTFLGLTLATTTSTELQIATNYRWSQQAQANAEAGIEAAKIILRDVSRTSGNNLLTVLPPDRTTAVTWKLTGASPAPPTGGAVAPGADSWGQPLRQLENAGCDKRGGGVGYGAVLSGIQSRTTLFGQQLNGAVTIWVRRGIIQNMDGSFRDDGSSTAAVVTAEGVAPYTGGTQAMAFVEASRAVRVLEASMLLSVGDASACTSYSGQGGGGVSGSGFWGCGITPDMTAAMGSQGALGGYAQTGQGGVGAGGGSGSGNSGVK